MPTYNYHCNECGEKFSAMRRMAQRAEAPPCPKCQSEHTELGISAPFLARAGSGGGGGSSCSSGFG